VSCFEHAPVKLKKTTSGSEEWLDAAVAYRIHLRTNGTATSAIGILTSRRMPWGLLLASRNNSATQRERRTGPRRKPVGAFY